jgi:type VI secretion system protein ImpB
MADPTETSVAPKERVNIRYRSDTGGVSEDVELPLRILLLGDFTGRADSRLIEERKPISLSKENFSEVMKAQSLSAEVSVPNRLDPEAGELALKLNFEGLNDFRPEGIVEQVPELQELIALREALRTLRGAARNVPDFVKRLQTILKDDEKRSMLLRELGIELAEGNK